MLVAIAGLVTATSPGASQVGAVCSEGLVSYLPLCAGWLAGYNGPANGFDEATALGVSPDSARVYVTGSSLVGGSEDYATLAYGASTGVQQWLAQYNGPGSGGDYASALGVSPDGTRVYVTGRSVGSGSSTDYATVAYDAATGAQVWAARYNGPANGADNAAALAVSQDGNFVYVTGGSWGGVARDDYATVAYHAATGVQAWVARYAHIVDGESMAFYDQALSVGVSPDGNRVYVTGSSSPGAAAATVAYDAATGTQVWLKRYRGPSNLGAYASALAVSPDGARVYVTGSVSDASGYSDAATVAYAAATGTQAWVALYNGPGSRADHATALAVSPDSSRVYVTAESRGGGCCDDYATVAYAAADGAPSWVARYDGTGIGDFPNALRLNPSGTRVYVTGDSLRSIGGSVVSQHATVGYDVVTGAQVWDARYNGPTPDSTNRANSLGVSPDGARLYVAGFSGDRDATYRDYATLGYDLAQTWVLRLP